MERLAPYRQAEVPSAGERANHPAPTRSIVGHSAISPGVGGALHVGSLRERSIKSTGSTADNGGAQVVAGIRVVDDEFVSLLADGAL